MDNKKDYIIVKKKRSIWKFHKKLRSMPRDKYVCPKCKNKLKNDDTLIPFSETLDVKVFGKYCNKCDTLYINNPKKIKLFLLDKKITEGYTLNGYELWHQSELELHRKRKKKYHIDYNEYKNKFNNTIKSSALLISVEFENFLYEVYIIVADKKDKDTENRIYHYLDTDAIELISAATAEDRNKRGVLNGKEFKVISCESHDKKDVMNNGVTSAHLYIRRDGGFCSSILDSNYEIVAMLLYSPITRKCEVIHATYDKKYDEYFTDIKNYRYFVKKYGNPQIKLSFYNSEYHTSLNDESVLHQYGYSVGQKEGLSTKQRHELLAEVVDLGILDVRNIVNLLDYCISSHSNDKFYVSREKWKEDKEFIINYKINPDRFMIAENKI